MLRTEGGTCFSTIPNYSYSPYSGKCERFLYSGCGGNHNRFRSKEDCMSSCACHMPPEPGRCNSGSAWFYNPEKGCCEKYTFGGCPGSGNAFKSYQECKETCAGSTSGVVLPLGSNWGSSKTVQYDLEQRSKPSAFQLKFRIPKSLWLHNENFNLQKMNPNVRNFLGVVRPAGRIQVPGVQTKAHWQMMTGGSGGMQPVGGGFVRRGSISGVSGMQPVVSGSGVTSMSGGFGVEGDGGFQDGGSMMGMGLTGMAGGGESMMGGGRLGLGTVGGATGGMGGVGGASGGMFGASGSGGAGISDVHFPGSPNDIIDAHSSPTHPGRGGLSSTGSVSGGMRSGMAGGVFGTGSGLGGGSGGSRMGMSRTGMTGRGGSGMGMSGTGMAGSGGSRMGMGGRGMTGAGGSGMGMSGTGMAGDGEIMLGADGNMIASSRSGGTGFSDQHMGGGGIGGGGGTGGRFGQASMRSSMSRSAPVGGMGSSGVMSRGGMASHPAGGGWGGAMVGGGDMVGGSLGTRG